MKSKFIVIISMVSILLCSFGAMANNSLDILYDDVINETELNVIRNIEPEQQLHISGELNNPELFNDTLVIEMQSKDIIIDGYSNKVKNVILNRLADNEKEANDFLISEELLFEEAVENVGIASDNEVAEFIANQKQLYSEDSDARAMFNTYLEGINMSEEEFWQSFFEEYRQQLTIDKYYQELYTEFVEKKVQEKVEELGWELNNSEINSIVKNELLIYNPELSEEFSNVFEQKRQTLLSNEIYNIQIIEN